MVTEKDLYVGLRFQYNSRIYEFTKKENSTNIDFEDIKDKYKHVDYPIHVLLRSFNDKSYILLPFINKCIEIW